MKRIAPFAACLLVVGLEPGSAEAPPDQINSFLQNVPRYGEPTPAARAAARRQAMEEQYARESSRAITNRSTSRERAAIAADRMQEARRNSERTLDEMGAPISVYRKGDYESRTYRYGDTTVNVTTQDGVITGSSSYHSSR